MPTRKHAIKVYVDDSEYAQIVKMAKLHRVSISKYCKQITLGFKLHSNIDQEAIKSLVDLRADLGRLGGLLKMWLLNEDQNAVRVSELLAEIEDRQSEIIQAVARL